MKKSLPNVVYIFADQWRRDAVGFMGKEPVLTPRIDQFAEQALCFEQSITCTPICSPHRASLMTGKYSLSTGVYTNCKLGLTIGLEQSEVTISDVLKQADYATAYIGKWHLDCPEQNFEPLPRSGARDWDAYTPPGAKRHQFDYWYSYGTYDEHLTPHYWQDSEEMIQINEWSVKHETDMALQYLESVHESNEPFALFLSWNPPHSPFDLVPDSYKKLYEGRSIEPLPNVRIRDPFLVHTGEEVPGGASVWKQMIADYYAAITGIDGQFGRVLDKLEQLHLTDNTIVVLTADHGELMGAHGFVAKHSWHEESIGVPFMLRYPQQIVPARTRCVLNTVDIMPTLLELIGLDVPSSVQGQSMIPHILDEQQQGKPEDEWAEVAYISAFPGQMAAIERFQQHGLNHLHYGWRGVRSRSYTYVVDRGYSTDSPVQRLLYDLRADPSQCSPLHLDNAKQHPVSEKLEQYLIAYLKMTNDEFDPQA
ncbi:sulfatase [Paenibacillus pinisoli]|uniref:Sulfatase n=1 Tax=Paenibacillus pinisoli TaxID=1276110 RepID=A0A3A6PVU4_9BACL|nr:sulfatase [Paenibacillus pinisoli]RJX39643.1 sulfatase [Paenibacillus pinisoli]